MVKIDWDKGFLDTNGRFHTRKEIEDWYLEEMTYKIGEKKGYLKIKSRLETKVLPLHTDAATRKYIKDIASHVKDLLMARPESLMKLKKRAARKEKMLRKIYGLELPPKVVDDVILKLKKEILEAFNYSEFRKDTLAKLASKLNVKSCPYCNQHLTLCVETDLSNGADIELLAEMQFDHFIDKAGYPMLSMSLYNLVPSCPLCNNVKGAQERSLNYHPYYPSSHDKFSVNLEDSPLPSFYGDNINKINLSLRPNADYNNKKRKKTTASYNKYSYQAVRNSRHKDIIDEVYVRAYLEEYYSRNGNFTRHEISNCMSEIKSLGNEYAKKDKKRP